MTDEKQIEIKRGTGVMADLLNKEMDSLIKSYKCGDCVHLPLCMAQKGGVNLGLASENDCMYYQPKLPENSVVLTREEAVDMFNSKANGFMTSPIGDLPLNIDGMRKAVDEIARLINVQIELQELNIEYYNDAKDLKRELKQARKETAREIICKLWHEKIETEVTISKYCSKEDAENIATSIVTSIRNTIKELAKQYGVEIEE